MKNSILVSPAFFALLFAAPGAGHAQFSQAQSFLSSVTPPGMENALLAVSAPDSAAFADGTRAINESRWTDAVNIFTYVAQQRNAHADGALYWKAYAQNKLGQTRLALETCAQLRHDFPSSSWIHECGALEIEMRAQRGQPAQPKAEPDENLKLLAINELMKKDEPRALAELQEILVGDASEKLKKEAQFILNQHYSDATYAQIARISYMEGDVRINRGRESEATWEKAVANLPLETGFSLVTGAGRVEIELEDASTLYLGDDSVLLFNDLHTTSGIPYSELALLSGMATLHIQPYAAGDVFVLKTPTGSVIAKFPETTFLRVNSYADGLTVTEQKDAMIQLPGDSQQAVEKGQTLVYTKNKNAIWLESDVSSAFAEWDKWVQNRVSQRAAAIAEVMQASGLNEPIPGMAEMKGQGTFFECRPYGTCWEPNAVGPADNNSQPTAHSATAQSAPKKPQSSGVGSRAARTLGNDAAAQQSAHDNEFFPCFPQGDIGYGESPSRAGSPALFLHSYDWAVCHTGGWVHMRNHYVWVAGRKRHHLGPGRWIKSGHTVALVPIHPWDANGRPPINRFEEVLALNHKNGLSFERTRLDSTGPVKILDAPPKEFNKAIVPNLARVEEPRMEAFMLKDAFFAGSAANRSVAGTKGTPVKPEGIPLSFNHKTQSFMVAEHLMQGNSTITRTVPFDNHGGNLQVRAGNYSGSTGSRSGISGGGGYRGGGASSSSSGGSRGGGGSNSGSSNGGSHSGGGSSSASSGGGSHSSGASSSSSSASSSAPSSSSSSSSAPASSSHH